MKKEKKFLEESYIDLINKEKEKIKKDIKVEEIKVLISAFSLSRKESLMEEYPFEKDLRIFPNIEKIYLLYTKETQYKFDSYKNKCDFSEKIIGVEIDGTTVDEVYKSLKKMVFKNEINKNDTILDITLGMKTISIAFYRIAVERQIKSINWNEKFLNSYTMVENDEFEENKNGQFPRIALSAKLSLMKEPIKESLGIYSKINENIKKGAYGVVATLYKTIRMDDMAYFYKELSNIFDIEKMLEISNSKEFYQSLKEKLETILYYEDYSKDTIFKIKDVVIYLISLVCQGLDEKMNFKKNKFDFKEKDIKSMKEKDFQKENYFLYLKCKYSLLNNRFKYYYGTITDGNNNKVEDEIYNYAFETYKNKGECSLEKIFSIIFQENKEKYNIEDETFINFDIEDYLIEDIEYKLKYSKGILEIPNDKLENFIIKIDFNSEEEIKKYNKIS